MVIILKKHLSNMQTAWGTYIKKIVYGVKEQTWNRSLVPWKSLP